MNLPEFSVKQSLFVNLLSVFFIIAGTIAAVSMSREAFPNISMARLSTAVLLS